MFFRSMKQSYGKVRRTWWVTRIESAVVQGNYSDTEVHREVREQVEEADGYLVASLTENGYHAPALDLDLVVNTHNLGDGVTRLSFPELNESARPWRKLVKIFGKLGMLRPGFESDEKAWQNRDGKLRLELAVPVQVVPSSTFGHHHVYIDVEMPWRMYLKFCRAMQKAGLLEKTFVDLMVSHGMSMLIKPGLTKKGLRAKGIELRGPGITRVQPLEYPTE